MAERNAKLRRDLEQYVQVNRAGMETIRSLPVTLPADLELRLEAISLVLDDVEALLRGEELEVHVAQVVF